MATENPCAKVRIYPPGRRTKKGRQFPRTGRPRIGLMIAPGGGPGPENLKYYWPAETQIPPGFSRVQIRFKEEGSDQYIPLVEWDPDNGDVIPIEGRWGCYKAVALDSNGRWVSQPSGTVRIHPILPSPPAAGDRRFFESGSNNLIERSL